MLKGALHIVIINMGKHEYQITPKKWDLKMLHPFYLWGITYKLVWILHSTYYLTRMDIIVWYLLQNENPMCLFSHYWVDNAPNTCIYNNNVNNKTLRNLVGTNIKGSSYASKHLMTLLFVYSQDAYFTTQSIHDIEGLWKFHGRGIWKFTDGNEINT